MKFLISPELQRLCGGYDVDSLMEVHPAFTNNDVVRPILQKERLLSFPTGHDINGVKFETARDKRLQVIISISNGRLVDV